MNLILRYVFIVKNSDWWYEVEDLFVCLQVKSFGYNQNVKKQKRYLFWSLISALTLTFTLFAHSMVFYSIRPVTKFSAIAYYLLNIIMTVGMVIISAIFAYFMLSTRTRFRQSASVSLSVSKIPFSLAYSGQHYPDHH